MKRIALAGLAIALGLSIIGAGSAQAQTVDPNNCGDAVIQLTSAQAAHDAALLADQEAYDAKAADSEFDNATSARKAAFDKLGVEATPPIGSTEWTVQFAKDLVADRNAKLADNTPDSEEGIAKFRLQIRVATAFINADARLVKATKESNKTDADARQKKADKTDAKETLKALDAAKDDFKRLCETAPPTTVPPTTVPPTTTQPPAADNGTDDSDNGNPVVVDDNSDSFIPNTSSGVDTGDGSTQL